MRKQPKYEEAWEGLMNRYHHDSNSTEKDIVKAYNNIINFYEEELKIEMFIPIQGGALYGDLTEASRDLLSVSALKAYEKNKEELDSKRLFEGFTMEMMNEDKIFLTHPRVEGAYLVYYETDKTFSRYWKIKDLLPLELEVTKNFEHEYRKER